MQGKKEIKLRSRTSSLDKWCNHEIAAWFTLSCVVKVATAASYEGRILSEESFENVSARDLRNPPSEFWIQIRGRCVLGTQICPI